MMKKERLPLPVTNLRKIWNQKKHEMQITQVEAAQALGWTQGAFSQYLNNITELGPAAVIKLANFLGVDPLEIDPDVRDHLENFRKFELRYTTNDANTRLDESVALDVKLEGAFLIEVSEFGIAYPGILEGTLLMCAPDNNNVWAPRVATKLKEKKYVVQRKGRDCFEILKQSELPAPGSIKKRFVLYGVLSY